MEDEFWKQASGSGAANAATMMLFFLIWLVRNKCRHSKCVGHSICCDIQINDDGSESQESSEDLERQADEEFEKLEKLRDKIEIKMQKLHSRVNKGVPGSD